jgi:hypothetical protein
MVLLSPSVTSAMRVVLLRQNTPTPAPPEPPTKPSLPALPGFPPAPLKHSNHPFQPT